MKKSVLTIVASVSALAVAYTILCVVQITEWRLSTFGFWACVCLASEAFWVRNVHSDSAGSLGGTARLSVVFMFGPWVAIPIIFIGTLAGLTLFRRPQWYKAVYNSSQLTLSSGAASWIYIKAGGPVLTQLADGSTLLGIDGASAVLASSSFMIAFLASGLVYYLVNNSLMAWLMYAVTGRRIQSLLAENVFYPEAINSSVGLILMAPLFVLLYGAMGILGLIILFMCLSLLRAADHRFVSLVRAQDSLVRGERMAAMGDMAQEIGVTLGSYLKEIKQRTANLVTWAGASGEDKLSKSANIIHVNVDHIAALVDGLAAFSHQETQKIRTDVNELLRRTIEFVRPQNRFDGIEFSFTPGDLPEVHADPGQLQQVIINLLANAADAMNESKTTTRIIALETTLDPKNRSVQISVADSGPGIPKGSLSRIFEPHFTTKVHRARIRSLHRVPNRRESQWADPSHQPYRRRGALPHRPPRGVAADGSPPEPRPARFTAHILKVWIHTHGSHTAPPPSPTLSQ